MFEVNHFDLSLGGTSREHRIGQALTAIALSLCAGCGLL